MIIKSRRVLYRGKLQPATIYMSESGLITDVVLQYDPRLNLDDPDDDTDDDEVSKHPLVVG